MTKFMFRLSSSQYLTQANASIITKQKSKGPELKPQGFFFFCLTLKRRPNSLPDALPAMNRTPLVGEVQQSMAGARQTITEITNYRKYNKNSLERRAGAHLTSRETNNHIHKSFSAEAD